jgi:hypothetical protein
MERGWHGDHAQRPSFQELMAEKVFDKIIAEAVAGGEELVSKLVNQLNISTGKFFSPFFFQISRAPDVERVSWKAFKAVYCQIFGHNPTQSDTKAMMKNLKSYLHVTKGSDALETANFFRFTQWWKPLKPHRTCQTSSSLLLPPWS